MPSYAPTYTPVSYEVTSYQMYEEPKQYYQSYSAPAYSPPTYEMPSYAPTYSAPGNKTRYNLKIFKHFLEVRSYLIRLLILKVN